MRNDGNGGGNTFMHLLLGFMAGALTVILSDEKKRAKIKEAFDTTLEKGKEMKEDLEEKVQKGVRSGRRKIASELEKTGRQMAV